MRRLLLRNRARELLPGFAAGVTLLSASLANFLGHNDYPFLRPEVALLVAGILLISACMAAFHHAQRQWGRSALEGLLAALFVDLNSTSLPVAVGFGVAVAAFTWWKRRSLLGPMAVLGAVILVTTVIGVGGGGAWISSEQGPDAKNAKVADGDRKPAILHIILDEHIGIEGLPADNPNSPNLRDELIAFYLDRGFALYGGAYSEHWHTVNAIPHILNFGARLGKNSNIRHVEVGPTEHLKRLAAQGYRLNIFQSDYADLCTGAPVAECVTYKADAPGPTLDIPLTTQDRSLLILNKFLTLSDFATGAIRAWNVVARRLRRTGLELPTYSARVASRSSSVAALEMLDRLAGRLRGATPGNVYFAHILLPHHPSVVRSDCRFLPWARWDSFGSDFSLRSRQDDYFAQVRCTTRKLSLVLRAFSTSPAGKNGIVIINGDHGSRITMVDPTEDNVGKVDQADMVASYSTLFAVRGPGIGPAYVADLQPVASLLRVLAAADFRSAPSPKRANVKGVILDDEDWKPRLRVPIADFTSRETARPVNGTLRGSRSNPGRQE